MSKLSALEKALWKINDDSKVDSSNIIEKLKSELHHHHVNMYNAWKESGFDINANSFNGSNLSCLASGSGCVKVVEILSLSSTSYLAIKQQKIYLHFL